MHEKYGDDVQFLFIYCREAHAIDGERPGFRTLIEEPISTDERRKIAAEFVTEQRLVFPTLLDAIDDKTGTDFAAHPDRLYLVGKDGKLAWVGDQGPRGFRPTELEAAILTELGRQPPDRVETRPGEGQSRPPSFGGGFRPGGGLRPGTNGGSVGRGLLSRLPVMAALDADGDGKVSAAEIENAAKALQGLDKDKNGRLTPDELTPSFGGRGGFGNRGVQRQ